MPKYGCIQVLVNESIRNFEIGASEDHRNKAYAVDDHFTERALCSFLSPSSFHIEKHDNSSGEKSANISRTLFNNIFLNKISGDNLMLQAC